MLANDPELGAIDPEPRHKVQLPDDFGRDFFRRTGYSTTTADECRSRARLAVRQEAQIELLDFPNRWLPTEQEHQFAIVKDLSHGGVAILFHEQLFPEDVFCIYVNSRRITAKVVRCRRLGPKCYEIGAEISATTRES